jgi:hypothetical protein
MPRLHDDQRANGVLGDERQVEQYIARPRGGFRPDGGVRVRSAQPLGKTQGVRLLREAERLRGGLASSTITNDVGGVSGTSLTLLTSLVAAGSSEHAAGLVVRSLEVPVARVSTAELAAV